MSTTVVETRPAVTTREVRERAAWYIEEFGLCKGLYGRDADGRSVMPANIERAVSFCTMGALYRAAVDLGVDDVDDALTEIELDEVVLAWESIADWNDAPQRTAADVAKVLRAA